MIDPGRSFSWFPVKGTKVYYLIVRRVQGVEAYHDRGRTRSTSSRSRDRMTGLLCIERKTD